MTTIIGLQYDDHCEIAVDSRVTDDNGLIYSHPDMMKYAVRGAIVAAGSGEVGPCDIIQNMWVPPRLLVEDKKNIYKFMITKAMPSLRKCLTDNGYNFNDTSKDGERFHFIMACNGELFDVDEYLSVIRREDGRYATGSGGQLALGALAMGATALEALEKVSELSAYTAPPFYTVKQYKK